nr:hypothetical protein [Actinomyces urogenitalis]
MIEHTTASAPVKTLVVAAMSSTEPSTTVRWSRGTSLEESRT